MTGLRLQARYGDSFFLAEVVAVSKSAKRAKAPVKVHYCGYESSEDAWVALSDIKSKALPAGATAKAKAKPKAKATPKVDLSVLEKGTMLQAMASDGKWYKAEVVRVGGRGGKKVKVNFVGYTAASDEWVGAEALRSKALKATPSTTKQQSGPAPAFEVVPILKNLINHSKKGIAKSIVESSAKSDPKVLSYKALLEQVQHLSKSIAGLLSARKDGLPKHVAYLVNPSLAYAVTELSVWASGSLAAPLSVHSPTPELEYFLENSESALVIADEASDPKIRPVAEKLGRLFATIKPGEDGLTFSLSSSTQYEPSEDTKCTIDSNALILYTSGTTGKPKGAVHTFKSLSAQYASLSKAWRWTSKDYTLHVLPLHHIHGVQNILNTAIYNGAGVEVTPFDAGFCLKRLCSGDITCFHAVPTIYVKFTQYFEKAAAEEQADIKKGLRNSSLRYMVSGSAALPVPTMKSWAELSGHVLLERYGMTEIGMGLSNKITGTRYPGCVGWPLPFVKVKLDEAGAILIKAPQVFKEYYRNEEATKKEFTDDGWFKTGDSAACGGPEEELKELVEKAKEVEAATGGSKTDSGDKINPALKKIYRIMGRTSVDIIKSGGYKISALEIESVLLTHEKIKECAVIGKPDETWGEKVTAVCVLDGELTLDELRKWGKERLATYKVPQQLDAVKELPRNQMGKLEKKKVMEMYAK